MDQRRKIIQIKDIASDIKKVENEIFSWSVLDTKTDDPDITPPRPREGADIKPAEDLIQGQKSD